jgi:hypothetical protein
MPMYRPTAAVMLSTVLLPAAGVWAQTAPPEQPPAPPPVAPASPPSDGSRVADAGAPAGKPGMAQEGGKPGWRISFELKGSHAFQADFDGTPGSVAVTRAGAEVGLMIPLAEKTRLGFSLDWNASFYDFTDATGFAAGFSEPWEDVHEIGFNANVGGSLGGKWGYVVGATIRSSGEDGAEFSDTLTYGGFASVSHQCTESFSASIGVFVRSRLEDDALIIPIPGIDWKISEQWRLTSMNQPGLFVLYSASDAWTLSLGARYESSEFRLNDRDAAPEGIGRETGVPIEFGVEYRPSRNITLGATAGTYVYREFELDDRNGNDLSDFEADPGAVLGLNVKFAF